MSQLMKAPWAPVTLFVLSVGLVVTPAGISHGASLWKLWSKEPAQPDAVEELIAAERARRDNHIAGRCSALADQAQAKAAALAQQAARKARAMAARSKLTLESVGGLEGFSEGVAFSSTVNDVLELPDTEGEEGPDLESLTQQAPAIDPAKLEAARIEAQKEFTRAIQAELNLLIGTHQIDREFLKIFDRNGSFVPKYASRDKKKFDHCLEALQIGEINRCAERYRKLFADVEVAYFRIIFTGKRLQDLTADRISIQTRSDISSQERTALLDRLTEDENTLFKMRGEALRAFGPNYNEYMFVRSFVENRSAELFEYIRHRKNLDPQAELTPDEVRQYLAEHPLDSDPEFPGFMSRKAAAWPVAPTVPARELPGSWEVGLRLSQMIPDSHRKENLLNAIKGARGKFPDSTQSKFNILEKILAADKVYKHKKNNTLFEEKDKNNEEIRLTKFPSDHIRYIMPIVDSFDAPESYKRSLKDKINVILLRPTRGEVKTLYQNPKFHMTFEREEAKKKLQLEKSGLDLFSIFFTYYFQPVYSFFEGTAKSRQRPAGDPQLSEKPAVEKKLSRMEALRKGLGRAMGFSKELYFVWAYSGEIQMLRRIPGDPRAPVEQLGMLFGLNAKYNLLKPKDEFLEAAASVDSFDQSWVNIKSYVRRMSTSRKNSQDVRERYDRFLNQMIDAELRVEKKVSITYQPAVRQLVHLAFGNVVAIAAAYFLAEPARETLSLLAAFTSWLLHAGVSQMDSGIAYYNSHVQPAKPLPEIGPFIEQYLKQP